MAPDRSTEEDDRLAVTIVVGSVLVAVGLAVLYWAGWIEYIIPAEGVTIDALPLLLVLLISAIALTIWGWGRVLSRFG